MHKKFEDLFESNPSIDRVVIAIIAKYGYNDVTGEIRPGHEAIRAFVEDVKALEARSEAQALPTLGSKLEALKAEVGEDNFKGLLANPRIETLAEAAWERSGQVKLEDCFVEAAKLLNDAVSPNDIANFMLDQENPILA